MPNACDGLKPPANDKGLAIDTLSVPPLLMPCNNVIELLPVILNPPLLKLIERNRMLANAESLFVTFVVVPAAAVNTRSSSALGAALPTQLDASAMSLLSAPCHTRTAIMTFGSRNSWSIFLRKKPTLERRVFSRR